MNDTFSSILRATTLLTGVVLSSCIGQKAGGGSSTPTGPASPSASACDGELVPGAEGSIDDFEDGNGQMATLGGRDGYWYIAKDPNGSAVDEPAQGTDPVDGGAGGSSKAMHVKGHTAGGEGAWGVELGVQYVSDTSVQYDASKYAGISFMAKKAGDTSKVRVNVGDVNTHPTGGVCKNCWNHFRKDFTLSDDWQKFTMTWNEMKQRDGWGDPRPKSITPEKVVTLSYALEGGKSFEIWVDDITFLECKK
jgi:hypothetical protein